MNVIAAALWQVMPYNEQQIHYLKGLVFCKRFSGISTGFNTVPNHLLMLHSSFEQLFTRFNLAVNAINYNVKPGY